MTLRQKHLNNVWSSLFRFKARAAGRKATGGVNACAATASQYYIALGVIDKVYVNTSALVEALIRSNAVIFIALDKIQPGDLIVTIDDSSDPDEWPEHVWHYYGPNYPAKTNKGACPPGFGWAVDNYKVAPYKRNITASGPKTRAEYALRLVK